MAASSNSSCDWNSTDRINIPFVQTMNVYIPLDGWTVGVMIMATLLALWIERDWRAIAILWSAFFLAAVVHELVR